MSANEWIEEAGAWRCLECDTACRSDNPCDCCEEANYALDEAADDERLSA